MSFFAMLNDIVSVRSESFFNSVDLGKHPMLVPGSYHSQLCMLAAAAGILIHLGYFIRGEHHNSGPTIVQSHLAPDAVVFGSLLKYSGMNVVMSTKLTALVTLCYLGGLFGSMLLYRGIFHPLRRFEGPFLARFSNLYHSSLLKDSDNYRKIYELHQKYGPIVRTGMAFLRTLL